MGRNTAAGPVSAAGQTVDDRPGLRRLDGGAGDRRGGTRAKSAEPAAIAAFMRSDGFELAAYKGARLSFLSWDGQLRQPVLLADARSLVSVSPQPGFLHQFSELDTLGTDKPETKYRMGS